ncbi:endonuclease [Bacillus cereus]|uniref:Endonuclease n=1 Tax=Bacillus cereus TaxID=1396 RepID=A0A9X7CQW2_BACCE|nr:type I restriction endonuclease [Bacillus cereus]PGS81664.1 endonuclease [Bacillus cereus]
MELEKLKDDLKSLGKRIDELSPNILNEEQTKNAFIMPFFQTLGYDVFNPLEFVPEFIADVGIKKGEKVDYAIILDNIPQILIECKSITENLNNHDGQLFRYFATTNAKFGILTNGREYRFFTDLDTPNKMDTTPFLTVDISKIKESQFVEIAKFHKAHFDADKITSSASELKYVNNLKQLLSDNLKEPNESFVKYLVSEVYEGVKTQKVLDDFQPIIKKALNQFINEKVNEKLTTALNTNVESKELVVEDIQEAEEIEKDEIITTPEELEAYTVVKMITQEFINPERVFYRDNRSYFNVLLDNNIKKWILRYIVRPNKTTIEIRNVGTFEIKSPLDISQYSKEINSVIESYK